MACGCTKRAGVKYVWTDGTNVIEYDSEIQAKAKVLRAGGSYSKKTG